MDELRSPMNVGRACTAHLRVIRAVALVALLAAAVVSFASANASRARPAPLRNTLSSPEAVAAAVIEAIERGDLDRLRALALTEEEFRAHVWPDLPASRPERNVPFDFVWDTLCQNSEAHLRQTVARAGGTPVELRGVRFAGETSTYGEVTVRRDTTLVVSGPDGTERLVRLFGSTIEHDGAWKVFSYVVDD
jgi:hypothetical protein